MAHDFICPWCWVGFHQARRLEREFGIAIEWRAYELFPEGMEFPEPSPTPSVPNKPITPTRLELQLAAEGMTMPHVHRPHHMRTTLAHQAVEYAKELGTQEALIDALYHAYWERGQDINDIDVLTELARPSIEDEADFRQAVLSRRFADRVVPFDDPAYESGVYNVPTFFVGRQRLAEQPYRALEAAVRAYLSGPDAIYAHLDFPSAPEDRPYVFMNMVSTIDGKILTGERDESVHDLGSALDHKLMTRIESTADAVLIGANTLRATPKQWNPKAKIRVAVTRSGNVPEEAGFYEGDAFFAAPESAEFDPPAGVGLLVAGEDELDFPELLRLLRNMGVERLLVLGGSDLNAQLLAADLVDELFLTLAPKVKLGRDVPTYADGDPLPRESVHRYRLVEHHVVDDELFLRYRRRLPDPPQ